MKNSGRVHVYGRVTATSRTSRFGRGRIFYAGSSPPTDYHSTSTCKSKVTFHPHTLLKALTAFPENLTNNDLQQGQKSSFPTQLQQLAAKSNSVSSFITPSKCLCFNDHTLRHYDKGTPDHPPLSYGDDSMSSGHTFTLTRVRVISLVECSDPRALGSGSNFGSCVWRHTFGHV